MKHTLGPWKYSSDLSAIVFIDVQQHKIKVIADFGKIEHHTENARLIAAAPDLYFACRAALLTLEDDEYYYKYKDVVNTLRQAISKATKEGTQ